VSDRLVWAEDIPERWSVRRAKFLFRRQQRPLRSDDGVVTAFRDGQVTLRTKRRADGFTFAEKEIGYHGVRVGDLVIHAMDGFAGAIGVSDSDGKCSPVCSVCTALSDNIEVRYYASVLRHLALSGFISSLAKGIRERSTDFRFAEFKELALPVPPKHEQRAIFSFLDRKTGAIDALITKKERLIALLLEKRRTLITQAVTKGLNPTVRTRDTGIDGLDQVPVHWHIWQLRRVIKKFVDYRGKTPETCDDGIPLVTASAVRNGRIDHGRKPAYVSRDVYNRWMVRGFPRKGDVVFTTEGATFGETAQIADDSIALAQRLILFKAGPSITNDFLYLYFVSSAGRAEHSRNVTGSTVFGISADTLKATRIVVPPISEQIAISEHVQTATAQFDQLEVTINRQLALLREYRQALITAAVTGKIDLSKEAG
jgi:type I restriction enzyme, S subunit